ncbi:MAG: hypothetical protein NY202_01065 [Mollicutes bacterium UO1]
MEVKIYNLKNELLEKEQEKQSLKTELNIEKLRKLIVELEKVPLDIINSQLN